MESEYSGFFTKTIQDIITQYELNPMTTGNGKIEIFIAPNRQWTDVGSDPTTN
ncbi:MAG: hypothetical protein LBD75_07150 [Candidatus Peribacteria bacterium]|nr:hypothetical protein [Candidatus Peribacteria bacterium]